MFLVGVSVVLLSVAREIVRMLGSLASGFIYRLNGSVLDVDDNFCGVLTFAAVSINGSDDKIIGG